MSGVFDESELERAIIELFEREGYEHLTGEEIQRPLDEVLLLEDLREFIKARYATEKLTGSGTADDYQQLAADKCCAALRRESAGVFSCQ